MSSTTEEPQPSSFPRENDRESTEPINADANSLSEGTPENPAGAGKNLAEVFSSEMPRDALDGVSSGLGNVTRGVIGGLAMMMAAPIQGGTCPLSSCSSLVLAGLSQSLFPFTISTCTNI